MELFLEHHIILYIGGLALILILAGSAYWYRRRRCTPEQRLLQEIQAYEEIELSSSMEPLAWWMALIRNNAKRLCSYPHYVEDGLALWQLAGESVRPLLVLVMGEFKTGKSTFINTLLGEELLTTDVAPSTAVVSLLRYGEEKKIVLHHWDGHTDTCGFDGLASITAEGDEGKRKLREDMEYVEVFYPNELLRHINLIDTPGLNVNKDSHVRNTENFQQKADLVLWVFSAVRNAARTELAAIRSLGERLQPLAVINRIDEIDEEEESLEDVLGDVRRRLGKAVQDVLGVSARQAQKALQTGNTAMLEKSGWNPFREWMQAQIVNKSETLKLESIQHKVGDYCAAFSDRLSAKDEELQKRDIYFQDRKKTKKLLQDQETMLAEVLTQSSDARALINYLKKQYEQRIANRRDNLLEEFPWIKEYTNTLLSVVPRYKECIEALSSLADAEELVRNLQLYEDQQDQDELSIREWRNQRHSLYREEDALEEARHLEQQSYEVYSHSGIFGGKPVFDFSGHKKRWRARADDVYRQRQNYIQHRGETLVALKNKVAAILDKHQEIYPLILEMEQRFRQEQLKTKQELEHMATRFVQEREAHVKDRDEFKAVQTIGEALRQAWAQAGENKPLSVKEQSS